MSVFLLEILTILLTFIDSIYSFRPFCRTLSRTAFISIPTKAMPSQLPPPKTYHFNNDDDEDEDSADLYDEPENQVHRSRSSNTKKPSGACVDCKSVKVRCEFIPGEKKCRRCQMKNLPCHPRQRKKRKPAETHEQLQERSHEQDVQIQHLLQQYDQRRAEQKVNQWVSKTSPLTNDPIDIQQQLKWMHKGKSPESAVASYFSTGPGSQRLIPPEIVKHCALFPEDIIELFSIYFARVNPYFSLLDENYHTPEKLIHHSPFLFTVLCAVASRYYTKRPNLYPLAMEFARDSAGQGLIEGGRGVDVCQAYLIMAVYPMPKKRWAEDRSWLLTGVAIRMAIELELNQPSTPHCDERERLNRIRTWLCCFVVDGSHAIQYGKLPMICPDDYLARNSRNWYKSSVFNSPFDVHLCGYVQLITLMGHWRVKSDKAESVGDLIATAIQTQDILSREMDMWADVYTEAFMFSPLPISAYRANTIQMITKYLKLVVLLVGFQKIRVEDLRQDSEIFIKAVNAAKSVIQITLENLYPTSFLRYAMDSTFLFMSFAAAFLINLFRPRFRHLLDNNSQHEIVILVSQLVSVLGSSDVALDRRHTPALYSRFLSSLMVRHSLIRSNVNSPQNGSPGSSNSVPPSRHVSPPEQSFWPDVPRSNSSSASHTPDLPAGSGYQSRESGSMGMDFSMPYFLKTVASQPPASPPSSDDMDFGEPWSMWRGSDAPWPQPMPISTWSQ